MNHKFFRYVTILTGFVLFLIGGFFQFAFSEERIPDAFVRVATGGYAILVEKSTQTLFLYSEKNSNLELSLKFPCSTGENSGGKIMAGDKKTPVGIYFITDAYEDRYLSPIYGKKAFPIDYPNFLDRKMGRNGSSIWLHGTNKILKPMDSNGCVALENDNILALSEFITLNQTPVILVENINWINPASQTEYENKIMELINDWSSAAAHGSYHEYLACYGSDYLPDIQWWDDWRKVRSQIVPRTSKLGISTDQVGIYHHKNMWVAIFDCYLTFADEKIGIGRKKLFIESMDNQFRIVGDTFQTVSDDSDAKKGHPFVIAALTLEQAADNDEHFIRIVRNWLSAWSSMDVKAYSDYYSDDFTSDGLNKTQWVNRKKRLAQKYEFVNITASNFLVERHEQKCIVHFYQEYKSSGFSTQGTKTLLFVKKGKSWKIFQENWKEN